jgi:hypothetical protein
LLCSSWKPALLRKTNANLVKPEEVKAFEFGYRSSSIGILI